MGHYAADASAVAEHLDLRNAVHIGHSTGGGEVAGYVARFGQPQGRVAKAVLLSAVPPLMVKTDANPDGTPIEVFDGFRAAPAANRAHFFLDVASGPFYGFNRDGAPLSEGVIRNWWRQGMMGGANAHYEGIKAFSETHETEDLKAINVPTLVLQGDDDQIVPYKDASLLQAKLLQNATLKVYEGFPHGMLTTRAEVINGSAGFRAQLIWPPQVRGGGLESPLPKGSRCSQWPRMMAAQSAVSRSAGSVRPGVSGLADPPRCRRRSTIPSPLADHSLR